MWMLCAIWIITVGAVAFNKHEPHVRAPVDLHFYYSVHIHDSPIVVSQIGPSGEKVAVGQPSYTSIQQVGGLVNINRRSMNEIFSDEAHLPTGPFVTLHFYAKYFPDPVKTKVDGEVQVYSDRELRWKLEMVNSALFRQYLKNIFTKEVLPTLGIMLGGILLLLIISATIGWVTRGFLGVRVGRDEKPPTTND